MIGTKAVVQQRILEVTRRNLEGPERASKKIKRAFVAPDDVRLPLRPKLRECIPKVKYNSK